MVRLICHHRTMLVHLCRTAYQFNGLPAINLQLPESPTTAKSYKDVIFNVVISQHHVHESLPRPVSHSDRCQQHTVVDGTSSRIMLKVSKHHRDKRPARITCVESPVLNHLCWLVACHCTTEEGNIGYRHGETLPIKTGKH